MSAERGSQAVEFALVLPALLLGVMLLLQAATLAADHVAAQSLAGEAARALAAGVAEPVVAGQAELRARRASLAVTRREEPGDRAPWVVAEVRIASGAFRRLGLAPEAMGRAAARVQ